MKEINKLDKKYRYSVVFPGQGSQEIDMMLDFIERYKKEKETFDIASEILGCDLLNIISSDEERLNDTEYTQPIILVSSVAMWNVFREMNQDIGISYMAGHSLGEYSALICSESISFEDGVRFVSERGKIMKKLSAKLGSKYSMLAIVGLDIEKCEELVFTVHREKNMYIEIANMNSEKQFVFAIDTNAIQYTVDIAKELGAKLTKRLAMSTPSHCSIMKEASIQLEEQLDKIDIRIPRIPIIHNIDAMIHECPEEIREILKKHIYSPLLWKDTIGILKTESDFVFECGYGYVLSNILKKSGITTI